eukprot:TRINITY_DN47908_c0_g1_i1.p2 TRINITY_DN47908_c0_g1~~TRINITY_DN47908_c0_g1_i1.p2  ORF type:complete len:148 (+),score=20.47 TRINITY_DN47908_c0_g1_i1:180-623(+)
MQRYSLAQNRVLVELLAQQFKMMHDNDAPNCKAFRDKSGNNTLGLDKLTTSAILQHLHVCKEMSASDWHQELLATVPKSTLLLPHQVFQTTSSFIHGGPVGKVLWIHDEILPAEQRVLTQLAQFYELDHQFVTHDSVDKLLKSEIPM